MSKPPSNFFNGIISDWGFSWGGLIDNRRGEWWLFGQLFIIALHFLPALPEMEKNQSSWLFMFFGTCLFLLGGWLSTRAFFCLGHNLSPLPDPKPGAELVISGPYKNCRHPLYQGLLIASTGVAVYLVSLIHLVLFITLAALLIGKARREEKKLLNAHHEYRVYISITPAIFAGLPFLDWRA